MPKDKTHWENIYETKQPAEVSWTQSVPSTSLEFIHSFRLPRTTRIIDVGGGDSRLVDFLLNERFEHITVLDISRAALEKAKQRLGDRAANVTWIEQDITEFKPDVPFDCWHDRATFHFLITETQISTYLSVARQSVTANGFTIIGTFSETGPEKCSGLPIRQYSEESLTRQLNKGFKKIRCITEDHTTPFNTTQNFVFCSFKRLPD